jgi:hypothetical protein
MKQPLERGRDSRCAEHAAPALRSLWLTPSKAELCRSDQQTFFRNTLKADAKGPVTAELQPGELFPTEKARRGLFSIAHPKTAHL